MRPSCCSATPSPSACRSGSCAWSQRSCSWHWALLRSLCPLAAEPRRRLGPAHQRQKLGHLRPGLARGEREAVHLALLARPIQAEPGKIALDRGFVLGLAALPVGVVEAQDEGAAMPLGEQPG